MTDQPTAAQPEPQPEPASPAAAPVAPVSAPPQAPVPDSVWARDAPVVPEAPAPAQAPAPAPAPAPAGDPADGLDAFYAPPAEAAAPAVDPEVRRARRRAAVRWGCAAAVFALAGTGTALAVTAPERTDIPGLATASDGRYTFPALTLPPLPAGQGVPQSPARTHHADLRYLVLPAPKEAGGARVPAPFPSPVAPTASASADATASAAPTPAATAPAPTAAAPATATPGFADWVPCDAFLAEQQGDAAKARMVLNRDVCVGATVREWTASDGTRTQIRLLRFDSTSESWDAYTWLRGKGRLKAVPDSDSASTKDWDTVEGVSLTALNGTKKGGAKNDPTGRIAYLSAGDVVGIVTMTNPGGVAAAPFRQVVTLQADLLS
ncbi:hypothetical protein [Streptomyces rubellomurinus]|uniref:hypothetical protein n=1 Tax=Streptomyces rubellomurinus (strain ATCC 31215) TaxID=359131 RepID=UPI0005F21812|nr:hypothetical protein [Streptomyces rubellomurinus]